MAHESVTVPDSFMRHLVSALQSEPSAATLVTNKGNGVTVHQRTQLIKNDEDEKKPEAKTSIAVLGRKKMKDDGRAGSLLWFLMGYHVAKPIRNITTLTGGMDFGSPLLGIVSEWIETVGVDSTHVFLDPDHVSDESKDHQIQTMLELNHDVILFFYPSKKQKKLAAKWKAEGREIVVMD